MVGTKAAFMMVPPHKGQSKGFLLSKMEYYFRVTRWAPTGKSQQGRIVRMLAT
jgi:hypothetical protein